MNFSVKLRLNMLTLAIVLLVALIAWAAWTTLKQAGDLQTRLSKVQFESFQIAEHIQASIQELNNSLLLFRINQDSAEWERFHRQSQDVKKWIQEKYPMLNTNRERGLLNRIDALYELYLAATADFERKVRQNRGEEAPGFEKIENVSLKVVNLAYRLADAHREALELLFQESKKSLIELQRIMFGALFVLLVMGALLSVTVYKDMIAPLRLKLVESAEIIERQEKLAALGVLAAGVAHEIRNPLTAIKARLFTQQKSLPKDSPAHSDAVIIRDEINRLERIVKDVLTFANPSEPKIERVEAGKILEEVVELMRPQLEAAGIRVAIECQPELQAPMDAQQIRQVLINLIQNGAESIGKDGTIVLRARSEIRKLGGQARPVVILSVENTGKGMPPEVQRRLFDPFFSTKDTGTGLGLSISARIVEKHHGALEYQTQVNRGTTFGIVLPAEGEL